MITDKHAKHAKALADLLRNSDAHVPPDLMNMRAPIGGKRGRPGGFGAGGPSKRGRDCKFRSFCGFRKIIFTITSSMLRIPIEHKESICSLDSNVSLEFSICQKLF